MALRSHPTALAQLHTRLVRVVAGGLLQSCRQALAAWLLMAQDMQAAREAAGRWVRRASWGGITASGSRIHC